MSKKKRSQDRRHTRVMTLIGAALARCRRDAEGRLKLGDLWRIPAVGHNNLSHAIKRAGLAAQVITVRSGRNENRGLFAAEEFARQLAELIPPEHLWTRAEPGAPERRAADQETGRAAPRGKKVSREVSDGERGTSASTADLGRQLSVLLGHPVKFQLRATPDNWPALIDITMIFTGLKRDQAGFAVRRLLEEHPELRSSISNFKFPGPGQRPTSVTSLTVALDFAFLLPGKAAAQMRRQAAALVVRYLGGDVTLVEEVYTNRRAQESLATIPAEQRTPLEQVVRMCGEAVETGSVTAPLSRPPEPDVLRIHSPPIIMEPCPTGCLDGGPPHFYILGIPGQTTSSEGETGMVYRGGRTKDFDARLAEHRKTYGNGVHTNEPREERILASKMELSRVPDFIVELHKIRQADLQLENVSQATPKKRTREEAEDELAIAEIDAKRERLAFEMEAQRVETEARRVETEAKRERLSLETDMYRQREQFILQMAKDGHADAIRSLLAPRLPL